MSKEQVQFDPSNPRANVHGMVGVDGKTTCLTKDGKTRCTGCCFALHITSNGTETGEILKEAGEMCDAQVPTEGCAHIVNNQPEKRFNPVCSGFHCSGQIQIFRKTGDIAARQKLGMCNLASQAVGEIDSETFKANLKRLGL